MKEIEISLTEAEFRRLNDIYPPTVKSSTIGDRAEALVKYHFRNLHERCHFSKPKDGSDLLVQWEGGDEKIEIKGTAENCVAWSKLKVSSKKSHDLLTRGLPLYRVISVYDRNPRILILKHGEDFILRPEERWSAKPSK